MTTIEALKAIQKATEGYVPTRPCPVCDDFRNLNKLIAAAESAAKAEAEAFNKAREAWRLSDDDYSQAYVDILDAYFREEK